MATAPVPALSFAPELLLAAQGVRVAFFDVDGVMTDGGILYSDEGGTLVGALNTNDLMRAKVI